MAVPKKRRSKSNKRTHRATAWKIEVPTMVVCKTCGELHVAHRVCTACGYYKGRPVIQIKQKAKKEG